MGLTDEQARALSEVMGPTSTSKQNVPRTSDRFEELQTTTMGFYEPKPLPEAT